nr:hypothetical protein [Tanacetum cinerariifolium]
MFFLSTVPDTELVLYPLQDKLTYGDKSLDLSAFKLSRLFFSLLSLGSLVVGDRISTVSDEFPLPEDFPTASEERFPLLRKRDATAEEVCTANEDKGSASEGSVKKKGRKIAVTTKDMQKRRNDIKARTTLLLALPDEHRLRLSKYKTAQELWAAILKTFGRNEATRKTKKNILQDIISQLEFMEIEIEQDDLNQKLLTSLALEWLMHTIVWRNRSDLDTMSLDDLYNHLKVYELEVQKKSDSQNMAFISSAKNSSGNEEVNTASIPTASTQVSPASANVASASISLDTACAYIASQSNGVTNSGRRLGKRFPFKVQMWLDLISQRWSALTATRWATFLGSAGLPGAKTEDVIGEEENHALVTDEEAPIKFALMAKSSSDNEVFDSSLRSKACKKNTDSLNSKITDLSEKLSDSKNMLYHYKLGLSQVEARLVEFKNQEIKLCEKIRGLEFKVESKTDRIENLTNELEMLKKEKEGLDSKLTVICLPPAQVYSPPKKDMSWIRLPEFADDTITDYTRPSPSIESNPNDLQNNSSSVSENRESTSSILSKPEIKFVKAVDSPTVIKTNKAESVRKTSVKYAEMYRKTSKSSNVRGNQRNWNNLKSQQLGKNFLVKNKACFNCGDFNHLSYDCGKWVDQGKTWAKNNYTHKSRPPRTVFHKSHITPTRTTTPNMNAARPKRTSFYKPARSYVSRPFQRNSAVRTQSRVLRVPTVNRKFPTVNRKFPTGNSKVSTANLRNKGKAVKASGNSQNNIDDKGYWDSGCSRHMTGNISYLIDYEPFDGGYMSFGQGGCKITGKGTIKTECIVLGRNFKLKDDTNVLLRTPRQHNMYSIDLNNVVPHKDLTCLVAKASSDECTKEAASQDVKKDVSSLRYIALPNWFHEAHLENSTSNAQDACKADAPEGSGNSNPTATSTNPLANQMETLTVETPIPTINSPVPTACLDDSPQLLSDIRLISKRVTSQDDIPSLDNILTLTNMFKDILRVTTNTDDSSGVEADLGNIEYNISASPTLTFRIHKDHPRSRIIGPVDTPVQTRTKSKEMEEQSFIAIIHQKTDPALLQFCIFLCFLSQEEPKKIYDALKDPSWVEAISIGKKWVLKNKKDERGIVIRNKAKLVAQGHTQEEGIDYEEVFAPVARIKAIRLFLAYASFMGFIVYQMDVNSVFLYETIAKEVYVMQPPGFQDPKFPARVYKVEKAMYALTINLTVYVFHIRHFWSTARIETTDDGIKILATIDGKPRTISESSIRRNLKLKDVAGISSLPDADLFENLTLMGVNSPSFSGMTVPLFPTMLVTMGEGSGAPTEPHHTPSPEAPQSSQHDLSSSIHLPVTTVTIPIVIPTDIPQLRHYTKRARIAQSLALPTVADELASPFRDDS